MKFVDVWTGQYTTYAKAQSGEIFAWGLNNYFQLGMIKLHACVCIFRLAYTVLLSNMMMLSLVLSTIFGVFVYTAILCV